MVDGQVLGKSKETRGEVKKGVETRRKEETSKGVNWATMYMNVGLQSHELDVDHWLRQD